MIWLPAILKTCKNLCCSLFNSENFVGVSNSSGPDVTFFNSLPKEQTNHFSFDSTTVGLNPAKNDDFSILHLNIRSHNKYFENSKTLFAKLGFRFEIVCLIASWCSADAGKEKIYGLPGYTSLQQGRNHG